MVSSTLAQPVPAVSADVLKYASEQGLAAYVNPVLQMTRRLFPNVPLTVFLQEDPEIADYRHITLEADVSGWDVAEMLAARQQWAQALQQHCPASQMLHFLLRLT